MTRFSWTQPQCGGCYSATNPGRSPHCLTGAESEVCVTCGGRTTEGIYIRIDPATAPHPTNLKE